MPIFSLVVCVARLARIENFNGLLDAVSMRILFANESPFLPQLVGGIEISTLDLTHALRERGQDPAVMSSLVSQNVLWLRNRVMGKLLRQGFPMDRYRELRVYRGLNVPMGLAEVTAASGPTSSWRKAVRAMPTRSRRTVRRRLGCKTFFYTHDLGVILRREPLPDLEGVTWIANSAFTARTLLSHLSVSCAIVPPLFRPEAYPNRIAGGRQQGNADQSSSREGRRPGGAHGRTVPGYSLSVCGSLGQRCSRGTNAESPRGTIEERDLVAGAA